MEAAVDYYSRWPTTVSPGSGALPGWADHFNELMSDYWSGELLWNCSMADFSTFRVGGLAEAVALPGGLNELSFLVQGLKKLDIPWLVIGRGSNIMVADEGLRGVVIVLGRDFCSIERDDLPGGDILARVKAGCGLAKLISWCADQGLTGLEFASGIPASVGGATSMNAGAFGGEIADVLHSVIIMNRKGNIFVKSRAELHPGYRSWNEPKDCIAVESTFRLKKGDKETIQRTCRQIVSERKTKQPVAAMSCGSFFKNPKGESAGRLIAEAGLKGLQIGGAAVSEKHANFFINTGKATAADIVGLMRLVQERVWMKSDVRLEPEVELLGFVDV